MQNINGWYLPDGDVHFRTILEHKGNYIEEHLLKALEFVKNWDTAVDVGAHIGLCSKILAKSFLSTWAFEPAPDTYQCLKKNLEDEEKLHKIVLYEVALGETASIGVRMEDDVSKPTRIGNTGARFVRKGGIIAMYPLDFFELKQVGFIKVDVEGYELRVLEGARETLLRCNPVVMLESGKAPVERYELKADAPLAYLSQLGMRQVARMKPDYIFVF